MSTQDSEGDSRAVWLRRLRWFAAEFLVVVAGILVALWLQGRWQARNDASREATYLRQLSADLAATERRLDLADSLFADGDRAQAKLVYVYQQAEPPALDSIARWLWQTMLRPTSAVPVMGTIDALVSTGDVALIRDESLRGKILGYSSSMHSASAMEARMTEQTVFGLKHEIAARVDLAELQARYYGDRGLDSISNAGGVTLALSGARRHRFPLNRESILADRLLYTAIVDLSRAKNNLTNIRRQMRAETETLRRDVERHLSH